MEIIVALSVVILALGIVEKRRHQKNIKSIPIRVNVNGIRGKSTATRLITAILTEAGFRTVGKTTGTSARMIYWNTNKEAPVIRGPQGANIGEQRKIVAEASKLKAEALVCECMAVNPDYQQVFQDELIQANVGVIVNVLEDHMDVMGPTLNEVAEAFTSTIPYKGYLIVSDGPYVEFFKRVAKKRGTKVVVADTSHVSESYLRKFSYLLFPENVALGLAVAEALGIDESRALKGMLKANPDPGAMKIFPLGNMEKPSYFANGFAANDAASTLSIWKRIEELGYPVENPVMIMNCRPDRVDRTEQFAKDVLPYINSDVVILIGGTTGPIVDAYKAGRIRTNKMIDLQGHTDEEVFHVVKEYITGRVIFGMGNIHGAGEPLIEALEEMHEKYEESIPKYQSTKLIS